MKFGLAVLCVLAFVAVAAAFSPSLPLTKVQPKAVTPALRTSSTLRMSANDEHVDLSKGNDLVTIVMDSVRRIFTKTDDDYPEGDGQGFTQTPRKPQRNKGDWAEM